MTNCKILGETVSDSWTCSMQFNSLHPLSHSKLVLSTCCQCLPPFPNRSGMVVSLHHVIVSLGTLFIMFLYFLQPYAPQSKILGMETKGYKQLTEARDRRLRRPQQCSPAERRTRGTKGAVFLHADEPGAGALSNHYFLHFHFCGCRGWCISSPCTANFTRCSLARKCHRLGTTMWPLTLFCLAVIWSSCMVQTMRSM